MTREEQNRIDELAASFFERSADIQALSHAIAFAIELRKAFVARRVSEQAHVTPDGPSND